jgi:GNAT superfamily N-acetyltransferase
MTIQVMGATGPRLDGTAGIGCPQNAGTVRHPGASSPQPSWFRSNYRPSAETVIRALNYDDWQDIRDVRLRSLVDAPDAFTSTSSRESAYDETKWRDLAVTGRWFVADDDGLVGVAVGVDGWSGDPKRRELVGMWVAPSNRRRGIARQLLDQVKTWAASEGATTLSLGVREGNEQALSAYLRMGMRQSGETMPEVGHPTNVIVIMECDIGQA